MLIGTMSKGDPEVDRRTIVVAQVVGAASGQITDMRYFNPDTGVFQTTVPSFNAVAGKYPGVVVYGKNTSGQSIPMRGVCTFIYPDNTTRSATTSYSTIPDGSSGVFTFYDNSGTYQQGSYKVNVQIQTDSVVLDSRTGVVIANVSTPPVGSIGTVSFWNPTTNSYQSSLPTIQRGQEAGVMGCIQNTAPYALKFRMDFVVKAPDGTQTSTTGEVTTLAPGVWVCWQKRWVCDKVGVYEATLILYAETV